MKSVTTFRKIGLEVFKGHRLSLITATFIVIALLGQVNHHVLGSGHGTIESALASLLVIGKPYLVYLLLSLSRQR